MSIFFLALSLVCIALNYYSPQLYYSIGAAISVVAAYLSQKRAMEEMRGRLIYLRAAYAATGPNKRP